MQKRNILIVAALAIVAGVLFNVVLAARYPAWRKERAAEIVQSYRRSALKGTVPEPADGPDSIRCYSVCYGTPPNLLQIKSARGGTFYFAAEHVGHSTDHADRWRFRFRRGTDANGNAITNTPGI